MSEPRSDCGDWGLLRAPRMAEVGGRAPLLSVEPQGNEQAKTDEVNMPGHEMERGAMPVSQSGRQDGLALSAPVLTPLFQAAFSHYSIF